MIIITNRNIQKGENPEERYGRKFNDENPDELTLVTANKIDWVWEVDIIDDDFDADKEGSDGEFASEKVDT